jgi:hypothetical protein
VPEELGDVFLFPKNRDDDAQEHGNRFAPAGRPVSRGENAGSV